MSWAAPAASSPVAPASDPPRPSAVPYDRPVLVGFVQQARILLQPGADARALGAAVTTALCGHWEHEGSCRWPHRSDPLEQSDGSVALRVVFASKPSDEGTVRAMITDALQAGELVRPEGRSCWHLLSTGPAEPDPAEVALTARWAGGGGG